MNIFAILAFIVVGLFIIIKLTEGTSKETSDAMQQRYGRWILPLVAVSLVLALLKELF